MIEIALAALFGLILGSFLNVCIYRLPRDLSVAWPGSHCLVCSHSIAPYDNIPVLSYFLLGGRCRHCRSAIYWRYPVVEALTAVLFAAGVWIWGPSGAAAKFAVFAFLQVGMIFSDLETRLLPDEFTKGGIVLGIVAAFLVPLRSGLPSMLLPIPRSSLVWSSVVDAAFAAAFLSFAMWGTAAAFGKLRNKEMLGFGDVKMVAMIGAFLGLGPGLLALMIGSLAGSVLGIAYVYIARKDSSTYELPYGSFLGAGALIAALWR